MIYTQPATFIAWLTLIVISASLSLIIGAIFWDVPNSDPQLNLNDRLGYHYSVMCVTSWPLLLLLTLSEVQRNRNTVERDIKDGLYTRLTYIVSKVSIRGGATSGDCVLPEHHQLAAVALHLVDLSGAELLHVWTVHAKLERLRGLLRLHRGHAFVLGGRPKVHLDFYLSGTAQRHRSNNFGADTDRSVRLVWLSDPLQGSTGVRQVVGVRQSHDLDSAVPTESRVVPRGHRQQFRADVLQEQTSATSGHHRPVALSHRERHPSLVELRISDVAVEVLQLRKHSHSFGCFLYDILRSRVFSVLVLSTQKFKK